MGLAVLAFKTLADATMWYDHCPQIKQQDWMNNYPVDIVAVETLDDVGKFVYDYVRGRSININIGHTQISGISIALKTSNRIGLECMWISNNVPFKTYTCIFCFILYLSRLKDVIMGSQTWHFVSHNIHQSHICIAFINILNIHIIFLQIQISLLWISFSTTLRRVNWEPCMRPLLISFRKSKRTQNNMASRYNVYLKKKV